MATWTNAVITNAGLVRQAELIAANLPVVIKTVKAGSGSVPLVNLRSQTALVSEKQELSIIKTSSSGGNFLLSVLLTTVDLEESYNLQQVGFYVEDANGNDILYAIAQANESTVIPTEEDMPLYSINFFFTFVLANDETMTATIDSTSLVSINDMKTILGDFASVEQSATSSASYEIGNYIIHNDKLYKVTDDISIGDVIEEGENVEQTTVGTELIETKEEIDTLNSKIGKVSTTSKSTDTSVSATGYATICTLSLPAGVYVLTGHVRFSSIPANRISVSVGTSASPGGEKDGVNMHYADAAANRNIGMQTSAIVTLSSTTTVYLSVYADNNATVSHGILTAVRLK